MTRFPADASECKGCHARKKMAFVMFAAALAVGVQAQQADRAKLAAGFAEVDRLLRDYATQAHAPGAAWGIIVDGQLAHTGTTGFRDIAAQAPVDADTVFRIASMT